MAWQGSAALRTAMADAITTAVGASGKLRIIDGTKPANVAAAQTGTTLAEFTLGGSFAPGASSGVLSPTLPAQVNGASSGTATHYRVLTSGGVCVTQGDVVSSGSGLVLNPSSNVITATQPVQATAWSITMPGV